MESVESGRLRIYLGAASGVGTTYAMLDEGLRRKSRGAHVEIGWADAHQRPFTRSLLADVLDGRIAPVTLDVEALIALAPDVVMIDELGRRPDGDPSGRFHWESAEILLDAGIDVVGTLNVQHIASLAERVEEIMGAPPCACIPERFLNRADQIELIDITPQAIRRRIAHGNVFTPTELQPTDAELFNTQAFTVLRALTVTWLAERLNAELHDTGPRERIVVLLDGENDASIMSRGVGVARRTNAELLALAVIPPGTATEPGPHAGAGHEARRRLINDMGGTLHEVVDTDVGAAVLAFAAAENASHVVTGTSPPHQRQRRAPSIARSILPESGISTRRRRAGFAGGTALLSVLTVLLAANRDAVPVPAALVLYLLAVVIITAVGGSAPGFAGAVIAPLLANWFLIPPYHTFRVSEAEYVLELAVFVAAAGIVSWFVAIATSRAADAEEAWREATTLASLSHANMDDPPDSMLSLMVDTFGLDGVSLIDTSDGGSRVISSNGPGAPRTVADAGFTTAVTPDVMLAAHGPALSARDRVLVRAFVDQLAVALEQRHLREIATEAEALSKADELRTSILRAVSHDLRSPLASIKASVSSLRQPDITWPDDVRAEFLEAIESDTDRLTAIITNLLDLSRLESGVLRPSLRTVSLEEVLPGALRSVRDASRVSLALDGGLPDFVADPALLERVLANVIDNAVAWSHDGTAVTVRAYAHDRDLHVHVIDHGVGIPESEKEKVIQPFHRLGDAAVSGGLGLGLAIADRLMAAMNGRLELRDTPGGGLTVAVVLPRERMAP